MGDPTSRAMASQRGMQPTGEQRAAIHRHDKNMIVVAGAGSGKTRVLVERYLQLLERNPDWRLKALVAITFTREAAYEMRHRVRLELEKRAAQQPHGPWTRHLSELDSARIDTIHGLCATILRANAAQAGIDPLFEVLDEVEAAILLETIIDDVVSDLDPALLRLFAEYDNYRISDTLTRMALINADLPDPPPTAADLQERWRARWANAVLKARDQLLESEAMLLIEDRMRSSPGDALGALYRTYAEYQARARTESDAERLWNLFKDWRRDGVVGNKGSAAAWGGKETKTEAARKLRDARDSISDILQRIGDKPGSLDQLSAELLPLWIKLLGAVQRAYRDHKLANALLDFDDLERLAASVLLDKSVRERYRDTEFKHLLVDEFQDTNNAQWQIISALADVESGGSLFLVGDPKQSVYQFRGADVSVFYRVRDEIAAMGTGLELPLSMSFRSHHKLVEQFNALFKRILARERGSPAEDYEVVFDADTGMTAYRGESPAGAVIECLLLDTQLPASESRTGRRKRAPADDMRRWEAAELAELIKTNVAERRQVFDRGLGGYRNIDYGDIAMLFQSMNKVGIYEDVFKRRDVPFLTVAGRGYFDRQEVWDMLDLLRCLHNPADNLSLASVLRSPMFGFSDDLLLALRLITDETSADKAPIPLWQALIYAAENDVTGIRGDDLAVLRFARDCLSDLRQSAGRVSISALLRRALAMTGYLAILTALPDGARRRGNLEKLLQLAEDSGKTTLGRFSRYLQDLTAREIREGEAHLEAGNAVRLMTAHASKGLEFPMVILADASWERGRGAASTVLHDPEAGFSCQVFDAGENKYAAGFAHRYNINLQMQKEVAERKRLLYVAATRAQDYLLISGQASRDRVDQLGGRGWLKMLLPALGLTDLEPRVEQEIGFAGGEIRVLMPAIPPPAEAFYADYDGRSQAADQIMDSPAGEPLSLPLLAPVIAGREAGIRHITATQIADLGAFRHSDSRDRDSYRMRWLRGTRHDLPATLQFARFNWHGGGSARVLGAIVHELLRYGMTEPDAKMIASLAWRHGITVRPRIDELVNRTQQMLAAYKRSEVYQWIESARRAGRPLFTELPFVYRSRLRVIHGIIDVLLQSEQGNWIIIDYKTSRLSDDTERYARRFRLQLGVYAAAAQAQLGLREPPQTYVHFIPSDRTLRLDEADCLAELSQLEEIIGEVDLL